jgi:DNA-binding PadR family transcriptional regulator
MLHGFFGGFIRIHVLHHAAEAPIYGLAMMEELRRHGYEVGPGTLYPLLHEMEEAGLLEEEDRVVEGRVRKYYRATATGIDALEEVRGKIEQLVEEVLEGKGPVLLDDAAHARSQSSTEGAGRGPRVFEGER